MKSDLVRHAFKQTDKWKEDDWQKDRRSGLTDGLQQTRSQK